jgi:hypothetical protein
MVYLYVGGDTPYSSFSSTNIKEFVMIKYLLNKLCNLFGYTIIPVVLPRDITECTKLSSPPDDNWCDCEECMPW